MGKRIILYGVKQIELRRDIEFFLGDDCEIVGYSDSYYTYDVLDGKAFFRLDELRDKEFDYIMPLSFRADTLADMERCLLEAGVSKETIVKPVLFLHHNAEKCQLDLVGDLQENYRDEQGLIFGLSYSLRGIRKDELRVPFYNCSWHGLDLYYCYKLFLNLRENRDIGAVKRAFLVFPYNFFNYDMSRAPYQYATTGFLFAVRRLDDWHHYREVRDGADYVANYRLFGEKIGRYYHSRRYEFENCGIFRETLPGGGEELGSAWNVMHEATLAENQEIFCAFVRALSEAKIETSFLVPPFCMEGLSQTGREDFFRMKDFFYRGMERLSGNASVPVFDYAELYADRRELFTDATHLNSAGAREWTQRINRDVLSM